MKTKQKLINDILAESNIHHNIRISYSKLPDYTDEDKFDWQQEASFLLDDFKMSFEDEKINDSGNRNLCDCKEKRKTKDLSICDKHDLWHIYSHGRMGATLYWDKYWNESNTRGIYFNYDESDLEEKDAEELKTILDEMVFFKDRVKQLMSDFYAQCEYRLKELRAEKAQEEKDEKLYQDTKKVVIDNDFIKRLVTEIL